MNRPRRHVEVRVLQGAVELETSSRLISFNFSTHDLLLMSVSRHRVEPGQTITVPLDRDEALLLSQALDDAIQKAWPPTEK